MSYRDETFTKRLGIAWHFIWMLRCVFIWLQSLTYVRSDTLAAINFGLFQMASNCLSEVDFVYWQYRPHIIYQHPEECILSIDHRAVYKYLIQMSCKTLLAHILAALRNQKQAAQHLIVNFNHSHLLLQNTEQKGLNWRHKNFDSMSSTSSLLQLSVFLACKAPSGMICVTSVGPFLD